MKKMLLGLAAVFALSSFTPAFAEDAPADGAKDAKPAKAKGGKKGKKAKKPTETPAPDTK